MSHTFGETGPFCGCEPMWIADGDPIPHRMANTSGSCQDHPIGIREPTIREGGYYQRQAATDMPVKGAGEILHAILNPPAEPFVHTFARPAEPDDLDDYEPPKPYTITDHPAD